MPWSISSCPKHHLWQVFQKFELLRWWTIKHHFEAIDKEMTADREIQQAGLEGGDEGEGPEEALVDPPVDPAVNLVADFVVNLAI